MIAVLAFRMVRAARTRAPAAINYDVYASRGKILELPGPRCNGASASTPSTFRIMDRPRPGKCVARHPFRFIYSSTETRRAKAYGLKINSFSALKSLEQIKGSLSVFVMIKSKATSGNDFVNVAIATL